MKPADAREEKAQANAETLAELERIRKRHNEAMERLRQGNPEFFEKLNALPHGLKLTR